MFIYIETGKSVFIPWPTKLARSLETKEAEIQLAKQGIQELQAAKMDGSDGFQVLQNWESAPWNALVYSKHIL